VGAELVGAGGDVPELLQLIEEALDEVAFAVDRLIPSVLPLGISAACDVGLGHPKRFTNSTVCRVKNSTGWPPQADRVDRSGGPDAAGSVDGRLWDVAAIHEIDAKQNYVWTGCGTQSRSSLDIGCR
jgi:hypothetical protein